MAPMNAGSAFYSVKYKQHSLFITNKVELLIKDDSSVTVWSLYYLYSNDSSTVYDKKTEKIAFPQ